MKNGIKSHIFPQFVVLFCEIAAVCGNKECSLQQSSSNHSWGTWWIAMDCGYSITEISMGFSTDWLLQISIFLLNVNSNGMEKPLCCKTLTLERKAPQIGDWVFRAVFTSSCWGLWANGDWQVETEALSTVWMLQVVRSTLPGSVFFCLSFYEALTEVWPLHSSSIESSKPGIIN